MLFVILFLDEDVDGDKLVERLLYNLERPVKEPALGFLQKFKLITCPKDDVSGAVFSLYVFDDEVFSYEITIKLEVKEKVN